MKETFRREIPAASEKPETRLLEARALFDMYKRSAAEEDIKLKVPDLIKLNDAFRKNPSFEKDREWLRDQLVGQFDGQSVETRLNILEHLADDDSQLASRLMEKDAERIIEEYRRRKGVASGRDAAWNERNAAARLEQALDKTINKIYGPDRIQEVKEQIGYENSLDETLRGSDYKEVKVRISHLRPPELRDAAVAPARDQWRDVTNFLKQIEAPAQVLEKWTGDSIADRKHFLSEQTNKALAVGIELIRQTPPQEQEAAGKKLLELCQTASGLLKPLQWRKGWGEETHREVSVPFDRVDNADIFRSFVQERAIKERPKQARKQEKGRQTKLEIEMEQQEGWVADKINTERQKDLEIEMERHLAMVGIEHDIPELVEAELARMEKRMEEIGLVDSGSLYEALEKRAETNERHRPLLDKFRATYQEYLNEQLPNTSYGREEEKLIEDRLADFIDPVQNWDQAAQLLDTMKKLNTPKPHLRHSNYFPEKLIDKCVRSLGGVPEDQRKERLSLMEQFIGGQSNEQSKESSVYFSETLIRHGLLEDAARYAGAKNLKGHIAKIMRTGNESAIEAAWKTKGWEPSKVVSELVYKAQRQESSILAPILKFCDRYRAAYEQIGRERYVEEEAVEIEKQLCSLITKAPHFGEEYIPPFNEEETARVRERIQQYRSFIWELWQQGKMPQNQETREQVLKMFVEDGRDLAIAELGLGADQKIELSIAAGKVAIEHKDAKVLKQIISEAKRLKAYEANEDARNRVAKLEKKQEMLALQTNIAEMNPARLRALFDQSPYDKDEILNALVDSGRYHDAITLCGELGQERIARQLINKGALDIAEELIKTAPAKMLPNRQALSELIAYRRAGGELKPEHDQKQDNQTSKQIGELPALLRAKGMNEQEILDTVRQHLSEDQRLVVDRCIDVVGQEEFLKTAPSYEENTLKHFYLDALFDRGKKEEAVRFALLHENGMLSHLAKRLAQTGSVREIEPLLYKVTDADTALEVANTLMEVGQNEIARNFVKRFVSGLTEKSPIFERQTKTRALKIAALASSAKEVFQEEYQNFTELKRLIFASGSLESLAHIRSLFKSDEGSERFVKPIFEGTIEEELKPAEMTRLLSALGPGGIEWYSNFLTERGSSKNIASLVAAIEILVPRTEAMKRYPGVYIAAIASSAKEVFIEDLQNLSTQERVQRFIDRYSSERAKDTVLLASLSLDKQEWNRFLQALPAEERERAIMLADWYAAPRVEEQNLGPVVERAAAKLTQALETSDFETLRLSLDTLLSARTPEAAGKLTRIFLEHLERGGSAGTTYGLVKTLSGMKSFKANTVLSEIMAAQGTPDVLSRYLIRLLVENGHLDADLKAYFEEKRIADKTEDGERLKDTVSRFRVLMQKYGINPDSSIMRYTDGRSTEEVSSSIERMMDRVKTFEERGEYQELGKQLMEDLDMRLLYFLRFGGRARFSLINDYNFGKFTNVLQTGNELELHTAPFDIFEQTMRQRHDSEKAKQIIQQVRSGRFPLAPEAEEAVFDCVVDANSESQNEQARLLVGNTLGRSEFGAFARAIKYRSFLDRLPAERKSKEAENLWQSAGQDLGSLGAFLQYCESTFGAELENLSAPLSIEKNSSDDLPLRQSMSEETLDIGITKIEPALTALGKKLISNTREATRQKKISSEERDRLIAGYQNPETVLSTLLASELPSSFSPVLGEWRSHVQAAIQASREARTTRRGESQVRQLQLRYLDKTKSIPEYLRFADSASCCFTSRNFQGTGPQQYIARIWKDPLSFVFHIEEPLGEQTDRRSSVGFVFGSYGVNREGEPVLILNGVYMDRKTDLATRKVTQVIEQQLAGPLGCKEMLVASLHAGRSNYGADYENTDREYLRLRAIKEKWNDTPEQHTYDDVGLIAVDAKEGRAQDSQAVNRWAKAGRHVLRKEVS